MPERTAWCPVVHPAGEHRQDADLVPVDALEQTLLLVRHPDMLRITSAARREDIVQGLRTTGRVALNENELRVALKMAWRNNPRCLGRQWWKAMQLRDHTRLNTGAEVADAAAEHLRWVIRTGSRRGQLIPAVTLFAADQPGHEPGIEILNEQLIRFAGYRDGATVLGDPRNLALTTLLTRAGWRPPARPGRFDVLPLGIRTRRDGLTLHELPDDAVALVALEHPEHAWFADLQLRWHAVPAISNMRVDLCARSWPAIFSGHYVLFELVKDLGDPDRYGMLPAIGAALGLDIEEPSGAWRLRAKAVLAEAIWHSYGRDGIAIWSDTEAADNHVAFENSEAAEGRPVSGDGRWLTPTLATSEAATYRRTYTDLQLRPDFVYPDALST